MENKVIRCEISTAPTDGVQFSGLEFVEQTVPMTGDPQATFDAIDRHAAIITSEVKAAFWKQAAIAPDMAIRIPMELRLEDSSYTIRRIVEICYDNWDDLDIKIGMLIDQLKYDLKYEFTALLLRQFLEREQQQQ